MPNPYQGGAGDSSQPLHLWARHGYRTPDSLPELSEMPRHLNTQPIVLGLQHLD
jgi:hypothetical protein